MRILVTGGAGFIGSHLCDFFTRHGHDVVCMDNFLTGSRDNIAHLEGHRRFTFIRHNVTEYIEVVSRLVDLGATVRAYDPVAMPNARRVLPAAVTYCDSAYAAADGADAVALLTEWNEFKLLNLERLRGLMRRPVIFDGRNLWEPERMRRLGFEYNSIGRRPVLPS